MTDLEAQIVAEVSSTSPAPRHLIQRMQHVPSTAARSAVARLLSRGLLELSSDRRLTVRVRSKT